MIQPLRIAHTSDVHLHDGEGAQPVRDAFARVIDAVIETRAQLFLIAGDLFDHTRIEGDVIDFVYAQLERVPCPTVVIAGNHDCWQEKSVLRRMDFAHAGHHVTLLDQPDGATVEYPALHATVWGRCMLDHAPSNKPMAGFPPRTRNLWHIGMAHGLYTEDEASERSSLITAREVEACGFDYLALGHVHAHRTMRHGRTVACYPGAPAAQLGTRPTGSMAIVDLEPGRSASVIEHCLG